MYMKEKNGVIVGRLCYGYEHEREKYCYCSRKYPTAFLCFSHCVFSILMPFLWSTTFCVFRHPDKWNVWLASRNGKVCIQCLLLSAVYEYLIFWLGHRQYPSPWININELLRMKYFQIDKSKVIPHPLWEIAKIYLLYRGERKYEERTRLKILTSSETRGMDFLRGRHSRSVLMSLKKGLAPGGPDCVAPVFSWAQILF